jgi:hypothetical protein
VARVVAVFDDLLLGSNVLGMLRAAGHEASLGGADAHPDGADALIVDLASTGFDGVALVERLRGEGELEGTRTLGVYSHVDAATAFWNAEGVALKRRRPGFREFRVDDYGAPSYPELVLCVTRTTLEDRRPLVRAAIRALQRGYAQAQTEPDSAVAALQEQARGSDRAELAAQLDAVSPAFTAGARAPGELREDVLRKWAAWDLEFGILSKPLDVSQAFDFDQVGPVRNP